MRKKSYRHVRVKNKDWNLIKGSNDIRVVIFSFVSRHDGVTEDEIEQWLGIDFNPVMVPAMCKYWLEEMESFGEIYFKDGLWHGGDEHGNIGRRRTESIRKIIRQLILEATASKDTTGYKMIFLAGLPGGGKSTLLRQLNIEDRFTNCNIDNFFEPMLMPELGTMNLEIPAKRRKALEKKQKAAIASGTELSHSEIEELLDLQDFSTREQTLFRKAIDNFRKQVKEICELGSNFIIDGTAASSGPTIRKADKYKEMGYDCAMIFVDIDWETSQQRNTARGTKGERAIDGTIIWRQGQNMPGNIPIYEEYFGDRFFLVSNKGTFEEYKENIETIRQGVNNFMES